MSNETPLTCACGGFWPADHVADCTSKEMAKLWPKSYRKELEQCSQADYTGLLPNNEHPADFCARIGITLD